MAEKILVTGGAGYVGSHCVLELVGAGYVPVVIDNFHNAIRGTESLPRFPHKQLGPSQPALGSLAKLPSPPSTSPGADVLPKSLQRVQQIVRQPILFQELDITDEAALEELFSKVRARTTVPQGGFTGCEGFVLGVGARRGVWTGWGGQC